MGREPITRFNTFQHTSTYLGVPALRSLWFLILLSTLFLHIKKKPLFLAALGFRCCAQALSSCTSRGYSSCGAPASHWVGSLLRSRGSQRGLQELWCTGAVFVAPGNCGTQAQWGTWDLPRSGLGLCVSCNGSWILYHWDKGSPADDLLS